MRFSWQAVVAAAVLATVGCDEKKSSGDDATKTAPDKSAATGAKATETAKAEEATAESGAFFMGRKFAFACTFAMLDKSAEAQKAHDEASKFGTTAGVTPPPLPSKDDAMKAMRSTAPAEELEKKHGEKAAAAYLLGVALTDAFFGASVEADIGPALAEVDKQARAAGVPESVWTQNYDAIKNADDISKFVQGKVNPAAVTDLAQAFEAHYKN
jgi:hypothetical protein